MTSPPSDRPVSALRARMIEDMNVMSVRGFSEKTRNDYIRNVRALAAFLGRSSDTATAEDLRRFQTAPGTDRRAASKHQQCGRRLAFLLHRDAGPAGSGAPVTVVPQPRRIPAVLSVEEVAAAAGNISAEVQGGVGHRLWRRAARLGSCRAQGRRCRSRANAAARRTRQGAQGPPRDAVAPAARTAARLAAGEAA